MPNKKRRKSKMEKLMETATLNRVKCEHCGHTMTMSRVDRMICGWCKHWVYKDDKAKFKYKVMEAIRNAK